MNAFSMLRMCNEVLQLKLCLTSIMYVYGKIKEEIER